MIALTALMIGLGVFVLMASLLYAAGCAGEKGNPKLAGELVDALGMALAATLWIVSWFVVRSLST